MRNNVIAADYDNVRNNIKNMEALVEAIEKTLDQVNAAIEEAKDWKGVDASIYRIVLKGYTRKIRNSARWLKNLDRTISNHSQMLYERALSDNSARNFR